MKRVVIFGLGDMARMAHFYFSRDPNCQVVAFTVTRQFIKEPHFLDVPVVAFEDVVKLYPPSEFEMYVAVGYSNLNQSRASFYFQAKELGYKLMTYVSDHATVLTSEIGDNTFIFEDNTIQPYVKIGNNVILWSGNHIGHDSTIKDHCFITSHVVVAGWTEIGEYTFIGTNATIVDKIKVAERCIIGAGALITRDTKPGELYKPQRTQPADIPASRVKI